MLDNDQTLPVEPRVKRGRPKTQKSAPTPATIKSLDTALHMLQNIAEQGPQTLANLSRANQASAATAYRALSTFAEHNLVTFDDETQLWSLGPQAYTLGAQYRDAHRLSQISVPILRALSHDTSESASLAVFTRSGPLILKEVVVKNRLSLRLGERSQLDGFRSAHGQVLYRAQTLAMRKRLAHLAGAFSEDPENTSRDEDIIGPSIASHAAPVYDVGKSVVASIGVIGPTDRVAGIKSETYARLVFQAATTLSMALGSRKKTQ